MRALVGIKPPMFSRKEFPGIVSELLLTPGVELKDLKLQSLTDKDFDFLYPHIVNRHFYARMKKLYTSEPWILMVFEGVQAIEVLRSSIGSTLNPEPGTIRARWGDYSMPDTFYNNACHCSDSERAELEIAYFFGGNIEI